jgi:hypothetical protein
VATKQKKAAARKNVKKAAGAAKRKKTIAKLPKDADGSRQARSQGGQTEAPRASRRGLSRPRAADWQPVSRAHEHHCWWDAGRVAAGC